MRGREWETICHCWVTLRSREQGLLSLSKTRTLTHTVYVHTHKPVLSLLIPDTHPDTYLHIPTHTETTQLEERLKVTEFYRNTSKPRVSDAGATKGDKHSI